jgi:4-carboxymuconolactone decarboxylase
MPRVPYVQIEDARAGDLASLNREIVLLRGRILRLHRVLANNPPALKAFMSMSRYVRDESTLSDDLRELAILAVAHALDDKYELHQHEPIARGLGITDAQLNGLPKWRRSTSFSDLQRAVIGFANEATVKRRVSDAAFGQVAEHLPQAQVVDLAVVVGWYHLCHVVIDALGVEIEPIQP